jgi:hypothetical protein
LPGGSFRTAVAAALTAQWQTLAPAEGEAKKKVANTSTVDLHVALELAVPKQVEEIEDAFVLAGSSVDRARGTDGQPEQVAAAARPYFFGSRDGRPASRPNVTTIVYVTLNITATMDEVMRGRPEWWYKDAFTLRELLECNVALANRTTGPPRERCERYNIREPIFPLKLVEDTSALRPGDAIEWTVELTIVPWYRCNVFFSRFVRISTWNILDVTVDKKIVPALDTQAVRRVQVRLVSGRRQVLSFDMALMDLIEIIGALFCITIIGRGVLRWWQRVTQPFGFHVPPGFDTVRPGTKESSVPVPLDPKADWPSCAAQLRNATQEKMNKQLDQTRKNNITFFCEELNLLPEELLAREATKKAMLEGNELGGGKYDIADYHEQAPVDEVFGVVAEPLAIEDNGDEDGDGGPVDVAVMMEAMRQEEEKEREVNAWLNELQKTLALEDRN